LQHETQVGAEVEELRAYLKKLLFREVSSFSGGQGVYDMPFA